MNEFGRVTVEEQAWTTWDLKLSLKVTDIGPDQFPIFSLITPLSHPTGQTFIAVVFDLQYQESKHL